MGFQAGFEKVAKGKAKAAKGFFDSVSRHLSHAGEVGSSAWQGLKNSGDVPLKKHLNPMSIVDNFEAVSKQHKGLANALGSKKGRAAFGQALGKSVPAIAATGTYAYGAKKLYDNTLGSRDDHNGNYMTNNMYY